MPRLIDADALVEWLKRAGNFLKIETDHKRITHIIGKIIDHMEAMPTIDPESLRPKGEWIIRSWWQRKNRYTVKTCSACGGNVKPKFKYNFCPNCGADMRGEKDG